MQICASFGEWGAEVKGFSCSANRDQEIMCD
jgi:hypothetical protein